MSSFKYCQSHIEDNGKCEEQCEHCKEYYRPLEEFCSVEEDIEKDKQDGGQNNRQTGGKESTKRVPEDSSGLCQIVGARVRD